MLRMSKELWDEQGMEWIFCNPRFFDSDDDDDDGDQAADSDDAHSMVTSRPAALMVSSGVNALHDLFFKWLATHRWGPLTSSSSSSVLGSGSGTSCLCVCVYSVKYSVGNI